MFRHWWRRPSLVACLALVVALVIPVATADRADAHAIVKATTPAIDSIVATPPTQVTMEFNEPVELAFGAIRVYDSNGERLDDGDARQAGASNIVAVDLEPDLANGTYTVTWRVISADGHRIEEAFVFHVGAPGANPEGIADDLLAGDSASGRLGSVLAAAARWLVFGSLLLLIGALGFALFIWPRVASLTPDDTVQARRVWRRLVQWSWVGLAFGTIAGYLLQGVVAGDLPLGKAFDLGVLGEVSGTRFGRVTFGRLGLLAALPLLMWSQREQFMSAPRTALGATALRERPSPIAATAVVVTVLAVAATPALAGHAGTTSPIALNVTADTLHVTAAGIWLGGLIMILLVVLWRGHDCNTAAAGALVARFSDVALIATGVVVATGVIRSWVEVRELAAVDTSYGLWLLAKVSVVVPIVAAGYVNNRFLKPKVVDADSDIANRARRGLRRIVVGEVALAASVLALTAVLVNLAPARVAVESEARPTTGPYTDTVALGDYRLRVLVDPNRVGENRILLTVTTETGDPAPVDAVTVLLRMPEQDIGPLVAEAVERAPGRFLLSGRQLPVAGRWDVEIVAATGRFDEERAETTVPVR